MIGDSINDMVLEEFTADEVEDLGLGEAIKQGAAKISGTYELSKDGERIFTQNNFLFRDKYGTLRLGRFKSTNELLQYMFGLLILSDENFDE